MKPNQHYFVYSVPKGLWEINVCGKKISTYLSTSCVRVLMGRQWRNTGFPRGKGLLHRDLLILIGRRVR